ncbi:DUF3888 domain-containing protein [Paenibacillus mucilaginosus]|uniref:DUF3888 domain-containing protein n=1 Tax=Paenibacillus mucilaginosus TaxID=61624 RepID=UPI003D219CF7
MVLKLGILSIGDVMKKIILLLCPLLGISSFSLNPIKAISIEPDCDKIKFALIRSLDPSIEKALSEIYTSHPKGPPSWAGWDTEILDIEQIYGVGGAYNVTVRVHPYYGPHIGDGIDDITINVSSGKQQVLYYKHIKDI